MTQAFSDDNDVLKLAFLKYEEQMLKNIEVSLTARAQIAKDANDKGKTDLVERPGMSQF